MDVASSTAQRKRLLSSAYRPASVIDISKVSRIIKFLKKKKQLCDKQKGSEKKIQFYKSYNCTEKKSLSCFLLIYAFGKIRALAERERERKVSQVEKF